MVVATISGMRATSLVQIKDSAGAVIAASTCDAWGRRQAKTVDDAANGYVYNGSNIGRTLGV